MSAARREAFRWVLLGLVVLFAAGGIYLRSEGARPCGEPITYAIGAVDPRFGISTSTLAREATAAAQIWNRAEGRTLLAPEASGTVLINLVYDERQSSATLGADLASEQAGLDTQKASLDAAKTQYDAQTASYNGQVEAINANGGATPNQAAPIEAEKQQLAEEGAGLAQQVAAYNQSVATFNAKADEYNRTVGHSFEEGAYIEDSSGKRIEIYEFVSDIQLERVLAHEMGHAIGLGHNGDPRSIMYAQNESGKLTPTATDLAALKAVCGS